MGKATRRARGQERKREQTATPAAAETRAPVLPAVWISLGLIAAVLFVYAQVHQFGFLNWDDPQYVTGNPHVLGGLSWQSTRWAFVSTQTGGLWLPLTWLSLMLDVTMWGPGAGGFHVTNLLLHAANAVLLFGLLQRTTGSTGRSAFVAALFAIHPLRVESVAWVTERKDVLSTFFAMLALWAYVGYAKHPSVMRYLPVVCAFALGLMAKPMVITLPGLLLLMDVWPLGRLPLTKPAQSRSGTAAVSGLRVLVRLLMEKIPLLVIALLSSVMTYRAQKGAGAMIVFQALPLGDRIQNALVSYVTYLAKMLWPSNLAGLYPYHPVSPAWVVGSAILLVGITTSVFLAAKRYPYLLVGWLWYLGALVPVIGLIQVGIQARADRFTYVPLIGPFIMVAWGASDFAARWPRHRAALNAAALVAVTACVVTARAQVGYWRDSLTFWQHAVDVTTDNARAHQNLGLVLVDLGRPAEAIGHYTEAIRISPEAADVHSDLGTVLTGQGRTADAVAHYREALRLDSNQVTAHNGLGSALDDQGKYDEAISHYRDALRIDPSSAMVHNNLGAALVNKGNAEEAVSHLIEACRLAPENADYQYNAAVVLERLGRSAEATRHLEDALRERPNHADARRLLEQIRASGRAAP